MDIAAVQRHGGGRPKSAQRCAALCQVLIRSAQLLSHDLTKARLEPQGSFHWALRLTMAQVERSCVVISSRFFLRFGLSSDGFDKSPCRHFDVLLPRCHRARLSYVDSSSCPWAVAPMCSRTKFSNTFQRLSHLYSSTPAAAKDGSECFLESKSQLLHINLACSAALSHVGLASMSCVGQTSSEECRCSWLVRDRPDGQSTPERSSTGFLSDSSQWRQ